MDVWCLGDSAVSSKLASGGSGNGAGAQDDGVVQGLMFQGCRNFCSGWPRDF